MYAQKLMTDYYFSTNKEAGGKKKIDQLKDNIIFLKTLLMSMEDRINAIKMVVLPKFKQLESIKSSFIWDNKINKKHLNKSKDHGGFALPNFKYYFWAANLNTLVWWRKIG